MDSKQQNPNYSATAQSASTGSSNCETPGAISGGQILSGRPRSVHVCLEVAATDNFSAALRHVVNGGKIARAGWNGKSQYVVAQFPDSRSKMTEPYLVLRNAQGGFLPWVPSQGDIFGNDWALLPVSPQIDI